MSGEKDYVDKQLDTVIARLEALSKTLLLDKVDLNQQAEKYLSLPEEALHKSTASELATGEYILSCYGLYLQRKANRSLAIKNWANKCLERIIAKNYQAYDQMMKFEIRKASIALNDSYAMRLSEIISEQESFLDDTMYLCQAVNNISNALGNLARIRSKNHGFGN